MDVLFDIEETRLGIPKDDIEHKYERTNHIEITYCKIEETTGQSKLQVDTVFEQLSRYNILSHQAGMRFFSPES